MARDGEILNRTLLQKAADFLQLGGVRQLANRVNLDQVQLTLDVGRTEATATPGAGEGELILMQQVIDLGTEGGTDFTQNITGSPDAPADGVHDAYRVDALYIDVTFDAAGVTAWNGQQMSLEVFMVNEDSDTDAGDGFHVASVQRWADVFIGTRYQWCLGNFMGGGDAWTGSGGGNTWNGRVPAQLDEFGNGPLLLRLRVAKVSSGGGNWPANTELRVRGLLRRANNGIVPRA